MGGRKEGRDEFQDFISVLNKTSSGRYNDASSSGEEVVKDDTPLISPRAKEKSKGEERGSKLNRQ